ncbi:MAG: hypothetical protein L0I17_04830 [Actinomycetia bacterium]|nr:hypothetical protein [Actinomycetes bacterium]
MPTRTPLGSLIQASLDAHGWSARKVEEISGGKFGLSRANLSLLSTRPLTSIKGETITALAEVLNLPSELVMRAALRSLKTPIELKDSTGSPEEAIQMDIDLSQADKQTLLRLLEVMRAEAGGEHDQRSAPMTHAGHSPATDDLAARRRGHAGTPDDAVHPGEDDWTAPPPLEQLAADDSPSEGRERRRRLDESEGA